MRSNLGLRAALGFSFGIAASSAWAAMPAGRAAASLDGAWQFRMDPKEEGEAGRWFEPQAAFKDKIEVPGAWDAQGFGGETAKVWHNFVGKGWYRREASLPEGWQGKRIFLTVGGVHRYAKVWVNGALLGEHIGYLSPFEYEITKHAAPGQAATIAICVDSKQRWDVDPLTGAFDLIDEMFIPWGGIWGHVALEARNSAWLEELFIRPKIDPPTAVASARVAGEEIAGAALKLEVFDKGGRLVGSSAPKPLKAASGKEEDAERPIIRPHAERRDEQERAEHRDEREIRAELPGALLWSPNHTVLYTARLSLLQGEKVLDTVETRFGLREIEIRGPLIYLNGKRIFLHGYGDDCVYPESMAAPADKAVYLKRLKVAKEFGFNYVRHHSTILPPEYFDAADEAGVLVSPELPIAYLDYYQRAKGPALDLYKTEWAAAIRRLRNHPSILDWCMGNEMWDGVPIAPDLYRIAKGLDPTRPVIDSNGLSGGGWLDGKRDRPTLDFFVYMFDLGHTPLERPDRHRFGEPKKPVISHEMGNFITFPRLDLIGEFKHNMKPFWLTPVQEKLEKLGLLGEADLWARNSERLYLLCHKLNIEDLRRNPFASGHQWWLLQDYWTGSNGLVDAYYRQKPDLTPERVRRFNGDVVLLLDGLPPTCRGKGPLDAKLLVSNYSEDKFAGAKLRWRVKFGGRAIAEGEKAAEIGQGEVVPVAAIAANLPDPPSPQPLTVEAELLAGETAYRNDWSAWVYPAAIPAPQLKVPLFAGPELIRPLEWLGAKPLPGGEKLPPEAVYLMSQPTVKALDAVAEGACLVMLAPQGIFPTERNRFKTGWWLGGPGDSNVGTVVYDNPVTREMAPDGWCDIGWHRLVEGSQAVILDGLPAQPEVLVRALDVHRLCRSKALLFQAKVGKGSILVSGLNLPMGKDSPPEAEWLLARLIAHAGTFPKPKAELPLEFLRQRVAAMAPPEGPFVLGFQKLVRNEGEDGTWHSFREDNARSYVCRQTAPGHLIEWETAPVPADTPGKAATFVFAGGLGWVSQPKTPGFTFLVNGQPALDFDVTQDRAAWKSKDGRVALLFCPMRPLPLDGVGLFYITLASDLLDRGKPCRFAVRSNGSGSRRWFGLNPYTDILGHR